MKSYKRETLVLEFDELEQVWLFELLRNRLPYNDLETLDDGTTVASRREKFYRELQRSIANDLS